MNSFGYCNFKSTNHTILEQVNIKIFYCEAELNQSKYNNNNNKKYI